MTPDTDSPTGLDMHPQPPPAVRVKRLVGVVVIIVIGLLAMMIVYGVYERQHRQMRAWFVADVDRKATPATGASEDITSRIPVSAVAPPKRDIPSLEDFSKPAIENTRAVSPQRLASSPAPRVRSIALRAPAFSNQSDAEQAERDFAYEKEQQAIEAPTSIGGGRTNPNLAYPGSGPSLSGLTPQGFNGSGASIPGVLGVESNTGVAGMGQAGEYGAQNGQDQKRAFIAQARNRVPDDYLHSVRTAPLTKFEIKAGSDLPATLEQSVNSDQPGEIRALVRENVFDTAAGNYVLIPQGSRLVGYYNSVVGYGQDGVQAVWDRVIFPDASSLDLNGMIGQDAKGEAGFRYAVDHHYARLLGFAVLTSLFSAGFQLSQNRPGTILAVPSNGEVVAGAVGSQVSQLGMEITRRNLNVQPTIKIPAGYRFNVRVNRDIVFDTPYSPLQ
jgi:type IV secretory pathway VirB10-like protein